MSLKKTAISGFVWTFTQQFSTQIISFIVSIIMARLLSPEEFGLISMISLFTGIGLSLMDSGLTQSLIRNNNLEQDDYSTVFFFNLIGSFIVYAIVFFSAPLIANFFNQPTLVNITRIYCLSFIISAFSAVQLTRLNKAMNFKRQTFIAIPALIGAGILGIYLAMNAYGVWSLIGMNLLQSFLSSLFLWCYSDWRPSFVFNIKKFKYHFNFGYKLTLSGILDTIFNNLYSIIIGKIFSPTEVGFFTRADALKQLPVTNISNVLNKVTYPLFVTIQNDDIRLKRIYKQIMQMVIFFIAPTLIFLSILAEHIFRLLFTEKWLPAVPYFQILCITGVLYPIHAYNLNILLVKGCSDLFFRLEMFKKLIAIVIIFLSVPFGIFGLLWGQVCLSIICLFINIYYSGKLINYNIFEQTKDIFPIVFLAVVSGLVVYQINIVLLQYSSNIILLTNYSEVSDFIYIVLSGFSGLSFYLINAWYFKFSSLKDIQSLLKSRI